MKVKMKMLEVYSCYLTIIPNVGIKIKIELTEIEVKIEDKLEG